RARSPARAGSPRRSCLPPSSSRRGPHLGDGVGEGDEPVRLLDMEIFDELAVDEEEALAGGDRLGVRGDDLARPRDVLIARREGAVGLVELLRVDERLAVESELASLPARIGEALGIVEVEMDAVEDGEA